VKLEKKIKSFIEEHYFMVSFFLYLFFVLYMIYVYPNFKLPPSLEYIFVLTVGSLYFFVNTLRFTPPIQFKYRILISLLPVFLVLIIYLLFRSWVGIKVAVIVIFIFPIFFNVRHFWNKIIKQRNNNK